MTGSISHLEPVLDQFPTSAVLIYSADSYVGYCSVLFDFLTENHCFTHILEIVDDEVGRLSEQQLKRWDVAFGAQAIEYIQFDDLVERLLFLKADFVFLGIPGRSVRTVCESVRSTPHFPTNSIIVTGFPGLQYFRRLSGIFVRSYADRLVFMDPSLHRLALSIFSLCPFSTPKCILLGSPKVKLMFEQRSLNSRKFIAFFEQNQVPLSLVARCALAQELINISRLRDDRILVLIRRNDPGELTNHDVDYCNRLDIIMSGLGHKNFEVFSGDWLSIADDIDFALSISSTALLEANLLDIPAFSLKVKLLEDNLFDASSFFLDRGFGKSADEIINGKHFESVSRARSHLVQLNSSLLPTVVRLGNFSYVEPRHFARHLKLTVLGLALRADRAFQNTKIIWRKILRALKTFHRGSSV